MRNKFYNGGFRIIKNTKATVVPVVFDNWNVIRPGSFRIRDLNIHFKILDPIFFKEYNKWTISTFSSIVKSRLIGGLIQIRNHRRKNEKNYYRNTLKYTSLDNELLKKIKQ